MPDPLPPIIITRKSGAEPLHANGQPLPFDLLSFWQWSVSDLVSNVTRGRLAEFIVATALGISVSGVRNEWDAVDLITETGLRVEVKSLGCPTLSFAPHARASGTHRRMSSVPNHADKQTSTSSRSFIIKTSSRSTLSTSSSGASSSCQPVSSIHASGASIPSPLALSAHSISLFLIVSLQQRSRKLAALRAGPSNNALQRTRYARR
jgi:hypothetical protein